jgi:DNA polymerase-4
MARTIIHLDLDAFYCAVEELRDVSLRGRAFAVGGRPEVRGVVASCSYAARRYGIRSAMPMVRALKLCPDLIILPGRHSEYSRVSRLVMEYLYRITPLVEQISIDEAFLDVTEIGESGATVALRLQQSIRQELGLPCSLGVASNKMVAKIATDVGKADTTRGSPPNAITVVPAGEEAPFLKPLPVEALWGVGPKTAARLEEIGIKTIGELAEYPEVELKKLFGKNGRELSLHARGIDDRPLSTTHETKSISQETTFARDIAGERELLLTLQGLSSRVADRLQKSNLSGSTVKIKIRWPDFTTLTRQMTLTQPTDQESQIFNAAMHLFSREWQEGKAVRLLGVGVSNLQSSARQLSLWVENTEREQRLQTALDALRGKYGRGAVRRGRDMNQK